MDVNHPLAGKQGRVYHHRHIASLKIGRWLTKEEVVHHKDHNRSNNNPDNLEVLTQEEHATLHHAERGRNTKTERECPVCGKRFVSLETTFCSNKCGSYSRGLLNELDSDTLSVLVWMLPTTKIAEMYCVSDTAIGKKCKMFGIEKPSRGYWEKIYHR